MKLGILAALPALILAACDNQAAIDDVNAQIEAKRRYEHAEAIASAERVAAQTHNPCSTALEKAATRYWQFRHVDLANVPGPIHLDHGRAGCVTRLGGHVLGLQVRHAGAKVSIERATYDGADIKPEAPGV